MAEAPHALPEIDFVTFILSLASSVLVHLGEVAETDGGGATESDAAKRVDLPLAKQTIDLVGMLQDKTRGNLNEAEAKLVGDVLFDLRIRYVDAQKRSAR